MKRAFCVGINDYPIEGSDLNGCVNDAKAWAKLLTEEFDFLRSDVKLLLDHDATKAKILGGIKDLLAGASKGDVLVFTNSSHGSYVTDESDDEQDSYDETMCPYDIRDNALLDDELRELFADLPKGVRLTVISDSCHSGTVTRATLAENVPGLRLPDGRRVRFLSPALFRSTMLIPNPMKAKPRRVRAFPESRMSHVLLSGCKDNEYSYDARIAGKFHGAMTYHAIKAIRDAKNKISYKDLAGRLQNMLDKAGYPQHPQLTGKSNFKSRNVFT